MHLSDLQTEAIHKCARADLRTDTQILSMLLAEGIRFYFFDNPPRSGDLSELQHLAEALELEAMRLVGHDL